MLSPPQVPQPLLSTLRASNLGLSGLDPAVLKHFFFPNLGMSASSSSSSRMRVVNHNWSDTKQRLHPQSVAEINRHSVLSGDRIRQCETSSGSRHKDTDQCKLPFPSAGTAESLFRAKTVQQRPLLPREVIIIINDRQTDQCRL